MQCTPCKEDEHADFSQQQCFPGKLKEPIKTNIPYNNYVKFMDKSYSVINNENTNQPNKIQKYWNQLVNEFKILFNRNKQQKVKWMKNTFQEFHQKTFFYNSILWYL